MFVDKVSCIFKSKELSKTAYFSYFHSVMIYDITFWSDSSDNNKVFLLQKRVTRIMADTKQKESFRDFM
jgi:hypothetical protein